MKAMKLETLDQINREAMNTLYSELGVSKTIRFIRQFRKGTGDYTQMKKEVFEGKSVEEIVEDMEEWQNGR
jgi:hypothetical protein